jgi:hypothetical protein
MGIIIAMIIAAGASFGVAHHDGLLKKGADSTRHDTYAFERHALESKLARVQVKQQRNVYALDDAKPADSARVARLQVERNKLEERITALKAEEDKTRTID